MAKCNREITFDKCDYEAHHDSQSSVIVRQMCRESVSRYKKRISPSLLVSVSRVYK